MTGRSSTGGDASWPELFAEFHPLHSLVKSLERPERAYEITRLVQEPSFKMMEHLLSDLTVVFSPPKVAGQTISATLWGLPGLSEPHHVHFLSDAGFGFMETMAERCRVELTQFRWRELLAHSRWVRILLRANRLLRAGGMAAQAPKPVLIAGVRDPMAQYLSVVFEHWFMYVDRVEDLNVELLHKGFPSDPWRVRCDTWFRDEMQAVSGVDVFAKPFPTQQGWDVYENEFIRLLVIRQENMDRFPQALHALLGIDPASIAVETRNVGEAKDYSALYKEVKEAWSPTEYELTEMYSSPQARHFYSPDEITKFQKRWQVRPAATSSIRPAATTDVRPAPAKAPAKQPSTPRQEKLPAPAAKVRPAASKAGAARLDRAAQYPHHHRASTCRPCAACAMELQDFYAMNEERDALMSFKAVHFLRKLRSLYRSLFFWRSGARR